MSSLSKAFMFVLSLASTSKMCALAGLNLKVVITQTFHPIDHQPVINLSQVEFLYNNVHQKIGSTNFMFSSLHAIGYPEALCNDDSSETMCQSGGGLNADEKQTLTIYTGDMRFNSIKVGNAFGFHNAGGFDSGFRIVGAIIQVIDLISNTEVYKGVFNTKQESYLFKIPFLVPTRSTPSIDGTEITMGPCGKKDTEITLPSMPGVVKDSPSATHEPIPDSALEKTREKAESPCPHPEANLADGIQKSDAPSHTLSSGTATAIATDIPLAGDQKYASTDKTSTIDSAGVKATAATDQKVENNIPTVEKAHRFLRRNTTK